MASRSHHGNQDGESADEDAYDEDVYDDESYDDDAVNDDDVYDDGDGVDEGSPVRLSIGERIRSGLQPGGTAKATGGGRTAPRSTKQIVERLDDRERLLCFAASALAVVAGVLIYVVEIENKHFRLTKGELTPETTLVIGFVVGGLLLGATLLGRRAPVGFVALFGFLAFGTQYFAGIPFLVLAVWLLVRSYKFQKEAAATRKAAMADGSAPARSGTRRARGATASRTQSSTSPTASKGPARPEANKRYTPKRAPTPPPKPSRRERKAAQASD